MIAEDVSGLRCPLDNRHHLLPGRSPWVSTASLSDTLRRRGAAWVTRHPPPARHPEKNYRCGSPRSFPARLLVSETSVPDPSCRRARRPCRIHGLKVQVIDDPTASAVNVGHVLRLVAQMMVRAHQADGGHQAIVPVSELSLELTVGSNSRPVDTNNEVA